MLRDDFDDAVRHLSRTKADIPEEVQKRLFGLHARIQHPSMPPPGFGREQLEAWFSAGETTSSPDEAMRAYIDLVIASDESFFDASDDEADAPQQELPAGLLEQLEAQGFKAAAAEGTAAAASKGAADVFTAARGEEGELAAFLPADCAARDDEGLTPLHHAVDAEQPAAVASLLEAKADPDAADSANSTPLHYAALLGASALVTALLRAGADPSLLDEDAKTPAQVARGEGYTALADTLLEAAGANAKAKPGGVDGEGA